MAGEGKPGGAEEPEMRERSGIAIYRSFDLRHSGPSASTSPSLALGVPAKRAAAIFDEFQWRRAADCPICSARTPISGRRAGSSRRCSRGDANARGRRRIRVRRDRLGPHGLDLVADRTAASSNSPTTPRCALTGGDLRGRRQLARCALAARRNRHRRRRRNLAASWRRRSSRNRTCAAQPRVAGGGGTPASILCGARRGCPSRRRGARRRARGAAPPGLRRRRRRRRRVGDVPRRQPGGAHCRWYRPCP